MNLIFEYLAGYHLIGYVNILFETEELDTIEVFIKMFKDI